MNDWLFCYLEYNIRNNENELHETEKTMSYLGMSLLGILVIICSVLIYKKCHSICGCCCSSKNHEYGIGEKYYDKDESDFDTNDDSLDDWNNDKYDDDDNTMMDGRNYGDCHHHPHHGIYTQHKQQVQHWDGVSPLNFFMYWGIKHSADTSIILAGWETPQKKI